MTTRSILAMAALVAGSSWVAAAQDSGERYYQAIRQDDLAALRALTKTVDVNEKDRRGSTPLFYAAAYGSLEAMRILVAAGADVNASNAFGATPLLVAVTEPEKVRFLVDRGADVNARSKMGRTPLWIAAATDGASATVRLLLDRGAKPDVRDAMQATPLLAATAANDTATIRMLLDKGAMASQHDMAGMTPLMNTAMNGNLKAAEWLLALGADVNAVSAPEVNQRVKNGAVGTGSLTALLLASAAGGHELVKTLLDRGAKIDVQDVRGMTPVMMAVATDHADVRTVRLLVERGANLRVRDHEGMTAGDWAKKYGVPAVLRELGVPNNRETPKTTILATRERPQPDPRQAVTQAVELLERTSAGFFKEGGCMGCHAQNLTALTVKVASSRHVPVDEAERTARWKAAQALLGSAEQPLLQRMDPPVAEILSMGLFELEAEGETAGRTTDALVHNLAGQQREAGNWHFGFARPPMGDGDFTRTAFGIRALQVYGPKGRKADLQKRVQRAAGWLRTSVPKTTEDANMRALGIKWAGAERRVLQAEVRTLLVAQRDDGGWGQTANLGSDAYATGETLYTLHALGLPVTDPAYQHGVQYLLRTQAEDGSWHVKSRAAKIQPYFESGFPYGADQWISSAATAWAATSLSYAIGNQQVAFLK